MIRIKLELTAVDDRAARKILRQVQLMTVAMYTDTGRMIPLAPQYSVSDIDGSCVCDVTREDNGIERGMEVTP